MRLIRYIGIALIVTLVSCTKTEIEYGQEQEIGFKPVNSTLTKTVTTTTLPQTVKLGVLANFENGNAYFGNTTFEYNSDKSGWACATPKYWPGTANLNFTVYAPFKDGASIAKGTDNITDKLTVTGVNADDDFMYGIKIYQFSKRSEACPVTLRHGGALLCFKATCTGENIKVKSITIPSGQYNKTGTAIVDYTNAKPTGTGQPSITWDPVTVSGEDLVLDNKNKGEKVPAAGQDIVSATEKGLLVLPGNQTQFKIVYTPSGVADGADITATITLGTGAKWEAGKKYLYTIQFTTSEIKFTASSEDWSEAPNQNIDPEKK